MDSVRLLEELIDTIDDVRSFGPVAWGFDSEEFRMQLEKIKANLPQEIKVANSTARESERIIEQAREDGARALEGARVEAERIVSEARRDGAQTVDQARKEADLLLENARLEQSRMLGESEVLRLARAQADELKARSERDALDTRRGSEKYAYDVLSQLEGVVGKLQVTIERGKNDLQPEGPRAVAPSEKKSLKA